MRVILGLGNPGPAYALTRHNAGMMAVDRMYGELQDKTGGDNYGWRREGRAVIAKFPGVWLVKSGDVFMNESGEMVRPISGDLRSPGWELYLIHDDLDIRLGEFKMQKGRGPKVHGGVNSVQGVMKGKDFWRVRIGVDNRPEAARQSGDEYVLERFTASEKVLVDEVISRVVNKMVNEIPETNSG